MIRFVFFIFKVSVWLEYLLLGEWALLRSEGRSSLRLMFDTNFYSISWTQR